MSGCAGGGAGRGEELGATVLALESPPASEALSGNGSCPELDGTRTIRVLEGAGAKQRQTIRAEPGASDDRWTEVRADEKGETVTEETFLRSSDGAVALERSVSHADKVITVFDPPMVVMPARLRAGDPFRQALAIRVHPIENPDTLRDDGPATLELVYEAEQAVLVGGEEIAAARVKQVFSAKLKSAQVRTEANLWYGAEGGEARGLVARRSREKAMFLGVTVRDVRDFWVIDAVK